MKIISATEPPKPAKQAHTRSVFAMAGKRRKGKEEQRPKTREKKGGAVQKQRVALRFCERTLKMRSKYARVCEGNRRLGHLVHRGLR